MIVQFRAVLCSRHRSVVVQASSPVRESCEASTGSGKTKMGEVVGRGK